MTVLTVALYALVAVLGGIAAFRHLAWIYALLATAGLVGLAFWVAIGGTQVEPLDGLRLIDAPALVGLAVAAAGAFGLPEPLARWFPFGFRSREWEYDRALKRVLDRYNAVLAQHPGAGDDHASARWERRYLDVAEATVRRLRSMRAPSEAWVALTEDYASLCERSLESHRQHEDAREEIAARGEALLERRNSLRETYRSAAERAART